MRRLLVLIIAVFMLCGCSKEEEIDMTDEVIEYIDIYYHANGDVKQAYGLTIDFELENMYALYKDYESGETGNFEIYNVDSIIAFIKDKVSKEKNRVNVEADNSSERLKLWSIRVRTKDRIYSFSDYEEYPAYWEDLWTMLVEATAAESISDFGFETK